MLDSLFGPKQSDDADRQPARAEPVHLADDESVPQGRERREQVHNWRRRAAERRLLGTHGRHLPLTGRRVGYARASP